MSLWLIMSLSRWIVWWSFCLKNTNVRNIGSWLMSWREQGAYVTVALELENVSRYREALRDVSNARKISEQLAVLYVHLIHYYNSSLASTRGDGGVPSIDSRTQASVIFGISRTAQQMPWQGVSSVREEISRNARKHCRRLNSRFDLHRQALGRILIVSLRCAEKLSDVGATADHVY